MKYSFLNLESLHTEIKINDSQLLAASVNECNLRVWNLIPFDYTKKKNNVVKSVQHFKYNHMFIALINELNQYVLILFKMYV